MAVWWVLVVLGVQRVIELALSFRNLRIAREKGGREYYKETFPTIVALHSFFLIFLLGESYPWRVPFDPITVVSLFTLILLQLLRYWCIATLGSAWNTRIIVVPGGKAVRGGPYRFLRHPNYLVVALEFLFFPLLLRTPITFAIFFPLNLLVLRQRIRLEEQAMRELTN